MSISNISSNIINNNQGMVQQTFSTGMLKKALNNEEAMMNLLLKSMPQDMSIGQNVDITV